jgi:hypothetical protein
MILNQILVLALEGPAVFLVLHDRNIITDQNETIALWKKLLVS